MTRHLIKAWMLCALAALPGCSPASTESAAPEAAANAAAPPAGKHDEPADAKVAGTDYNATADIPCTLPASGPSSCRAGVKRGPDQIAIEVSLPDGGTRVLLFDGKGRFVTHGSAQSDGSAALASAASRAEDWTVVTVGPESYRIPDAFVLGD